MAWFWSGNNLMSLSDDDLIDRYRNSRDPKYIGALYQRYTHLVYGMGIQLLDEEETRTRLIHQVFNQLQEDLRGQTIPHFKEWLWEQTLKSCKKLSQNSLSFPELTPAFTTNFPLRSDSYTSSQKEQINKAIESLPEKQQQCVSLFYFEQLTMTEIIQKMDSSFEKVLSLLQKGKRNTIKYLQDQ